MMSRKMWSMLIVCVFVFCSTSVMAGGAGTFSKGYRMGMVTKFSQKGFVMKSGEGQMLLGSDSTPYSKKDGDVVKEINPWRFSSLDKNINRELEQNMGEYVVLSYNQARIKYPNVDTEYTVTSVNQLTEPIKDVCRASSDEGGNKSRGKRVGRIVKASTKGTLIKSWEVLVQQGNAGNQFKHMSITNDKQMYECAVKYLKAGQKVKIEYIEAFMNIGQDTNYDIISLEPVKSLN